MMTLDEILTKDGWQYDKDRDCWTHPKHKGQRIEITTKGWAHKEPYIAEPSNYWTYKEGFSGTDLLNYLESLKQV